MADPPYQSLYRRYRPQRFSEVKGQHAATRALQNSVRDGRVAHAYLFSGPRGTGKTSTARILAKALNCADPVDGEPCGVCDSCVAVAAGASLDVHELDAASNNGVEAMRDLVSRAALGTPGRWKVYIVDEVHMLSAAASNALLKTLEEPPGHVVFVLATTDPQKVLPTIRSRTQHFEFRLLGRDQLEELVREVGAAAGLDVGTDGIDAAVRRGRGSPRDALSALDQVAASGIAEADLPVLDELVEALCESDVGAAMRALAGAGANGRDPQRLATDLIEHLREGLLATLAPELVSLSESDRDRVGEQARRLGLARLVRAMELLGRAQVDMRDALDPQVGLEVAVIRLVHPEADDSAAAILERVERIERRLAGGQGGQAPGEPPPVPGPGPPSGDRAPDRPGARAPKSGAGPPPSEAEAPASRPRPADSARAALDAVRERDTRRGPVQATVPPGAPPGAPPEARAPAPPATSTPPVGSGPAPDPASGAELPSRDELVMAWGDSILAGLASRPRARFQAGRFVTVRQGKAVYALPGDIHRSRCEECRVEVETALAAYFGRPVPLQLVVDSEEQAARPSGAPVDPDEEETLDPGELSAPIAGIASVEERLLEVFPGAEEVSP